MNGAAGASTPSQSGAATTGTAAGGAGGRGGGPSSTAGAGALAKGAGGSAAGVGHLASSGAPSAGNVQGKVVGVRTEQASPSGQGSRRTSAGEVDVERSDANGPQAIGKTDDSIEYGPVDMSRGELEALPPQRRAVVLRYLRMMREEENATASPPVDGTAVPAASPGAK